MGTPGRPAAPRYRARANGIHYGTHSVPRLQLMGHIRFHRTEAPTSVNNFYSHYASKYVAIYAHATVASATRAAPTHASSTAHHAAH